MAILDIGQSEMGHLVHRLPVVVEIGLGRVAADEEANGGAAKAEGRAALHAVAGNRDDQHARRGDRELAEIDETARADFSSHAMSALRGSASSPGANATLSVPPPTAMGVVVSLSNAS